MYSKRISAGMESVGGLSNINISLPKWQLAFVVGAPVALGLGYIYYKNSSKPSSKPSCDHSKGSIKQNGTKTDRLISVDDNISSNKKELPFEVKYYLFTYL